MLLLHQEALTVVEPARSLMNCKPVFEIDAYLRQSGDSDAYRLKWMGHFVNQHAQRRVPVTAPGQKALRGSAQYPACWLVEEHPYPH